MRTLVRVVALAAALMLSPPLLLPAARADDEAESAARRLQRRTPIVEAVEKAAPSVVSIGTKQLVQERFWNWEVRQRIVPGSLGSGVIVHPRGYVITNLHVINRAHEIYVKLTGLGKSDEEIPAKLIAVDPPHDLALLRLEPEGPYPAADFGSSADLMVGETVIAMGNPFGLGRTVSTGVVSALDRAIDLRDQRFEGLIQTDAAVNQGNSGGPLLNILGEWIGVNSAIYSLSGGSDGISFAIPVETARAFLAHSLRPRRISDVWLGLEFEPRTEGGVATSTIYPVGPARTAGLSSGVQVLSVDGTQISDLLQLRLAVLDALPHGSADFEIATKAGPKPVRLAFEPLPTSELLWQRFGLQCVEITDAVEDTAGYREGAGVVVSRVRKEGPADRIRLAAGDLLRAFGPRTVRSLEDLLLVSLYARSGNTYDLQLGRPRRGRSGRVQLDPYQGRITAD